ESAASRTPTPPPTVSLHAAADGAGFEARPSITLMAAASGRHASAPREWISEGSTTNVEAPSAPYTISWTNVVAGTYSVTARATRSEERRVGKEWRSRWLSGRCGKILVSGGGPASGAVASASRGCTPAGAATYRHRKARN